MLNDRYLVHGIPSNILLKDTRNFKCLAVEDGVIHITKLKEFVGDLTAFEFLSPSTGKSICIKGITITGDGNNGVARFIRSSDGSTIFPAFFSAQVRSAPSGAYNLVLLPNEKVLITTSSRGGTATTFMGVSYVEYDINDFIN